MAMESRGPHSPLDTSSTHPHMSEDRQHTPIVRVPTPRATSPQSSDGWSKASTPAAPSPGAVPTRQNQVTTVVLHGEPIVSLNIDAKERLCLAQISNTLLKDYSYNEIHNRRVALGITCVQCTPVQLEILRRAGAMPVSSRRCGMITKREAERLVKSFLEDAEPPKLPEDFAFQVYHECGWGCHGYFEPARYNSSRAKCIKCGFCSVYFSPNKFIFHFHRTADAKYHHPDAANFNSWRRHLKLAGGGSEEEMHLWEDVKAMFNGGTRKRVFTTTPRTSTSSSKPDIRTVTDSNRKTSKVGNGAVDLQVTPKHPFPTHFSPYSWYGTGTKPTYPFVSVNTSQSLCFGFPPNGGGGNSKQNDVALENPLLKTGMAGLPSPWLGRTALPFSNLETFWDKAFGLPRPLGAGFRAPGGIFPPPLCKSPGNAATTLGEGGQGLINEDRGQGQGEDDVTGRKRSHGESFPVLDASQRNPAHSHPRHNHVTDRFSAFRPVGRNAHTQDEGSCGLIENDDTALVGDNDDTEEIDVTEEDCGSPQDLSQREPRSVSSTSGRALEDSSTELEVSQDLRVNKDKAWSEDDQAEDGEEPPEKRARGEDGGKEEEEEDRGAASPEVHSPTRSVYEDQEQREQEEENQARQRADRGATGADDSGLSDESEADGENDDSTFSTMTKEELCQSLKKELCNRRKREKEVSVLKETFQEEVTREKAFRDQMARQLEVLRETLTNELEQERKVRFSLQQKLKEAHDALHSFSCSMLTAARDCNYKDAPLPR